MAAGLLAVVLVGSVILGGIKAITDEDWPEW